MNWDVILIKCKKPVPANDEEMPSKMKPPAATINEFEKAKIT